MIVTASVLLRLLVGAFLQLLVLAADLGTSRSLLLRLAHGTTGSCLVGVRTTLAVEAWMTSRAVPRWKLLPHAMLTELTDGVDTVISLDGAAANWIAWHTRVIGGWSVLVLWWTAQN